MANDTPKPASNQLDVSVSTAKKILLYEIRVLDELKGPGVLGPPIMAALLELDNAVYELSLVLSSS